MKKSLALLFALVFLFAALLPAQSALAAIPKGVTSKIDYDNADPNKYKIEIDLTNQVITVFAKDASGAYTHIALQGLCTTGSRENPTSAGTYQLGHMKERFGYFVAFGQYAQYWTQVVRGIYIHSVMYDSKNLSTMSKSAYNTLGKAASHGCVRVLPEHAKWIFYNCPPGTVTQIKKGTRNTALTDALRAQKVSYEAYQHPADFKPDPAAVAALVRVNNAPLRTGFSSKDKTVQKLAANTQVRLLQIAPAWCKVELESGRLGYVKTQYLLFNADSTTPMLGAYYAAGAVSLYQTASANATIVHTYAAGDAIDVLGIADKNWLTARLGKVYGYVRVKDTQSTKPKLTPPPVIEPAPGATATETDGTIRAGIIANMRSGPGSVHPIIAEFAANTPVRILEEAGSWYRVVANGTEGYINKVCIAYG